MSAATALPIIAATLAVYALAISAMSPRTTRRHKIAWRIINTIARKKD